MSAGPEYVCSRTSATTLNSVSTSFSEAYKAWATRLRRASLLRRKSAQRTEESGYLFWRTPQSANATQGAKTPEQIAAQRHPFITLADQARWATPTVQTFATRKQVGATEREHLLPSQAQNWPTATAGDSHGHQYQRDRGEKGKERPTLVGKAVQWPTANARDADKWNNRPPGHSRQVNLSGHAQTWPTPMGSTKGASAPELRSGNPKARLVTAAEGFPSSPLGRETSRPGGESWKSRRRLNPRFVEWLMGWPIGWTDCAHAATGWCHFKRRMRSALSVLLQA